MLRPLAAVSANYRAVAAGARAFRARYRSFEYKTGFR